MEQSNPPTYCKGCSFKCAASDCECTCHDIMRLYYSEKYKDNKKEIPK